MSRRIGAIFEKGTDEWETPLDLFEKLDEEFGFNYDPCATIQNKKCAFFDTEETDGLKTDWGGRRVFCNPPYSSISKWVEKAFRESRKDETLVVMLIPARTDTKYFHNFIYGRSEIRFVKGRLKFGMAENYAPFPSMIVIFRGAYVE